jgi:multiple antibiotic resistance protein
MGFLAIMNPLANTAIFLGLTEGDTAATRRAIAMRALLLTFVIVAVFSLSGRLIFQMFGITLPAFRIAGGILVFKIGYDMLQGRHSDVHHGGAQTVSPEAQLGIAVSPLAMPILAGPGTIATAMSFSAGHGFVDLLVTLGAFGLLCAISYFFFVFGQRLVDLIGESAVGVITRLMGLILAVIGVQMLIQGVTGAVRAASG